MDSDVNRLIGSKIREARKSRDITQTMLADRLAEVLETSYTQSTIGKIERGERTLTFSEIVIISTMLPIDLNELRYLITNQTVDAAKAALHSTIAKTSLQPRELAAELNEIKTQLTALEARIIKESPNSAPASLEDIKEAERVLEGARDHALGITEALFSLLRLFPAERLE